LTADGVALAQTGYGWYADHREDFDARPSFSIKNVYAKRNLGKNMSPEAVVR